MRSRILALIAPMLLAAGSPPSIDDASSVIINSDKAGLTLNIVAYGGGGTLRAKGAKGRVRGDTIWTTTPAEFTVNLMRGPLRVVSLKDSAWVAGRIHAPTNADFTIIGQRILITQLGGEVRVTTFQ